ncbi:MAG: N-acetylmuramoyl-L-alanine amidase [Sphingomonadales bacterium]
MFRPASQLCFVAVIVTVVLLAPFAALSAPEATEVRIGRHGQTTRFVLDLSESVDYNIFLLADPYRMVIDLPGIVWKIKPGSRGRSTGAIELYRYGLFRPGTSRIVLDLSRPATIGKAFLIPPRGDGEPYRLVIDLKPAERKTFLAEAARRKKTRRVAPVPAKKVAVETPSRVNKRPVIVIDAGHGGVDPGTSGVNGHSEKSITLKVALELKRQLSKSGQYQVVLTRSRDIFVPLRRRVEIARSADADIMISLHTDALRKSKANSKVRGATVYSLSERASDREAAALAAKENKSDVIAGVDLDGESHVVASILIDLAQRETMNFSAELASFVLPELGKKVKLRSNSHRFAGFRVLMAPDVPSILVEMGYLSNSRDAQFLASSAGHRTIAEALHAAIRKYFADHKS